MQHHGYPRALPQFLQAHPQYSDCFAVDNLREDGLLSVQTTGENFPSISEVAGWEAEPLTDVEIATNNFRQARLAAPAALDSLKGAVWAGLVAGGLAPDEATAAGVGLVLLHGPLLAAFEAAGGHPVAGQALYAAIASQESVAALPWLTEGILAIFAAALAPG